MPLSDNIIALATPAGVGAIAVIRISGNDSIHLVASHFKSMSNKGLNTQKSHTVHLGHIVDNGKEIDKVLVSIFKSPNSYTGENIAEISCHGSQYIQQQIIQLFIRKSCRMASPGEFTLRAFLNGKMDLSQAEAVADLIASDSEASHKIAMEQMRGGFSNEIKILREDLLSFASLIELELDFSEEDVEFADRSELNQLLSKISALLKNLIDSFSLGNAIKNGIPIAIIGEPNVGKSSLLNELVMDDRAIVSDIAGTTRDTVEDQISIEGINFRFIDTAGIRETKDVVEKIGIERTFHKAKNARLIIFLFDGSSNYLDQLKSIRGKFPDKEILIVCNKVDLLHQNQIKQIKRIIPDTQFISAKNNQGISELRENLISLVDSGKLQSGESIISNSRHYDSLVNALSEIQKVKEALDMKIPSDLMAIDIRQALYYLGEITGNVTTDDLLKNIFSNFCIGK